MKDRVLQLLSGSTTEEHQASNLISTFGDKEYSILSALASVHEQTKLSALQALQDLSFITGLQPNERGLVKLVLL